MDITCTVRPGKPGHDHLHLLWYKPAQPYTSIGPILDCIFEETQAFSLEALEVCILSVDVGYIWCSSWHETQAVPIALSYMQDIEHPDVSSDELRKNSCTGGVALKNFIGIGQNTSRMFNVDDYSDQRKDAPTIAAAWR